MPALLLPTLFLIFPTRSSIGPQTTFPAYPGWDCCAPSCGALNTVNVTKPVMACDMHNADMYLKSNLAGIGMGEFLSLPLSISEERTSKESDVSL